MPESLSTPSVKSGMAPGALIHVGDVLEAATVISVVSYNKEMVDERIVTSIDEIPECKADDIVTWIIVEGLANVEIVERIGELFDIHQLVLEDILNTHQRPKFEEYDDHLYIVLKCLLPTNHQFSVSYEQISLLVFRNLVFAFKEKADDLFQPIRERIKTSKGRFRTLGADYLTYAILDMVVDQGFILLDSLDDTITELEAVLATEPTPATLNTIQKLKREVVSIRRHVAPVRELMAGMLRSESELISEKTHVYLRDVSDHAIRVTESIESYRDILTGLLEIYISSVSNRMNEIMKVLTVFASIFIPLTFVAGIYGMNFKYMPELQWEWAYPSIWILFIAVPAVLLIYFRKKKWL